MEKVNLYFNTLYHQKKTKKDYGYPQSFLFI